ncbi:MAG: glucose-6-phosphate isomerase, partial [Alphaproteobacteria bacterium]|nr:glucose-6-phosphate isomerase [Alphaproteobacteria bacterium]
GLIAISKSGGTVETLTQLSVLAPWLVAARSTPTLAGDAIAITEPTDNPLRRIGHHLDMTILDHDPKIGGRFAALSIVGLLPAMIAGVDASAVRNGAATVLAQALDAESPAEVPPAVGAAIAVALTGTAPIFVMLPYLDRLSEFAMWYCQLWAESLGKDGQGATPVRALGTVDQHSQLQLYLDGPGDKYFTVLAADTRGLGDTGDIDLLDVAGDLDYLKGRHVGDVLAAEQEATIDTLIASGRPVRVIRLSLDANGPSDGLNAETMGGLMMHFMLETIIAADLMGVNPFDQPAVEAGKAKARDYLGNFASLAAKMEGQDPS